jgi:hypothetical protein
LRRPLRLQRGEEGFTLQWPAYLTGHVLEYRDSLDTGSWQVVSGPVTENDGFKSYITPIPSGGARFFRLRKPLEQPGAAAAPLRATATAGEQQAAQEPVRASVRKKLLRGSARRR